MTFDKILHVEYSTEFQIKVLIMQGLPSSPSVLLTHWPGCDSIVSPIVDNLPRLKQTLLLLKLLLLLLLLQLHLLEEVGRGHHVLGEAHLRHVDGHNVLYLVHGFVSQLTRRDESRSTSIQKFSAVTRRRC